MCGRCAFYGDCDPEIEKVTACFRLTLTYILRYDPDDAGIAEGMASAFGPTVILDGSDGDGSPSSSDEDENSFEGWRLDRMKDEYRKRGLKVTGNKKTLTDLWRARMHGIGGTPYAVMQARRPRRQVLRRSGGVNEKTGSDGFISFC